MSTASTSSFRTPGSAQSRRSTSTNSSTPVSAVRTKATEGSGKGRTTASESALPTKNDWQTNQVIWSKWGEGQDAEWWPAMIIDPKDGWSGLTRRRSASHQYVLWLGDGSFSQLHVRDIVDFWPGYIVATKHKVPNIQAALRLLVEVTLARVDEETKDWHQWALQNAHKFTKLIMSDAIYASLDQDATGPNR